jgi:hypothetical protein
MRNPALALAAILGAAGLFIAPTPAKAQRVFITPPVAVGNHTLFFQPFEQRVFVRRPVVVVVQRGMRSSTALHARPLPNRPRANPYVGPGWAPSAR